MGPSEVSDFTTEKVAWTEEVEPVYRELHVQGTIIPEFESPSDTAVAGDPAVEYGPAPLDISPPLGAKFKVHRAGNVGASVWVTSPVKRKEKVISRVRPLPWWVISKSDNEVSFEY